MAMSYADSLRELAHFLDEHPELESPAQTNFYIFPLPSDIRAVARSFGNAQKFHTDSFFNLRRKFGQIMLEASWDREKVCERVVVGTTTETVKVPITFEEREVVKEKVEWLCPKILEEQNQTV